MHNTVQQIPTGSGTQWVTAPPQVDSGSARTDRSGAPTAAAAFTINHRSFPSLSQADDYTYVGIHDDGLLQVAREVFPWLGSLYDVQAGVDGRALYLKREQLIQQAASSQHNQDVVMEVVDVLEREFQLVATKLASFPPVLVSWHLLWTQFQAGDELESVDDLTGESIALRLDRWAYVKESMGRAFVLSCHSYQWAGTTFHKVNITRRISQFSDLRAVSSLPAKPLGANLKEALQERGRIYLQHARLSHINYQGFFHTRAFSGATRLMGDGQAVIDVRSFRRANPTLDHWGDDVNDSAGRTEYKPRSNSATEPCATVTDDEAHLLPPTLHGFSLRAKRWGEFLISRVSLIEWGQASFAHLVIPDSYRRIIQALVTVHASDLKEELIRDVVEGKGAGLIMALHGTPGTGKTLTAEAIAEHLHRPLYIVGVGELSLTAATLERQLRDILELATAWDAVLLIDEADIFLTRRSPNNLEHNALVGVFLRLLEYFSGVLILTTNLIEQMDDAFLSRFAVVLRFEPLNATSRRTLWSRFIEKTQADLTGFDFDRLASFEMNGRDIKHAVRTAQAVALVGNELLAMAHVEEVLAVAKSGFAVARK